MVEAGLRFLRFVGGGPPDGGALFLVREVRRTFGGLLRGAGLLAIDF
jgi:hypothetical protein